MDAETVCRVIETLINRVDELESRMANVEGMGVEPAGPNDLRRLVARATHPAKEGGEKK